jgi:hypothetical protein
MEKRFQVKRFLFETSMDVAVCRFMLTDRLLALLVPNQYIELKSVNKFGTGKNRAYFSTSCMKNTKRNMTQRQTDRC